MERPSDRADMEGSSDKLFCCRWVRHKVPLTHREEMYHILRMTGPLLLSRILNELLPFVVTMFCGRLGNEVMAGLGLATGTINFTTGAIGHGLGLACDTLISQTFGGKNLLRVGVILQRGIIILLMFCLPCWGLLINAQAILLCMGQEPEVARIAQVYITAFLPGVPVMFLHQLQVSYLQNQGIILPQMYAAFLANIANVVTNYIFLHWLDLGVSGSAAANALTQIYICGFLFAYIWWKKLHVKTWGGWSVESLQEWGSYMKLAIPSAMMTCFEWWIYEIGGFFAGMLGENDLAAKHASEMVASITFMFPLGVQAAACARVGNALGAGDTARAILVSKMSLTLAVGFALVEGLVLGSARSVIGFLFTSDEKIVGLVSHLIDIYIFHQFFDSLLGVGTGIFLGTGKQKIPAVANFVGYYCIGLPLGAVLMFVAKLRFFGFQLGLLICVILQSTFYMIVIFKFNWKRMTEEAVKRAQKKTYVTLLSTAALSEAASDDTADQTASSGNAVDGNRSLSTSCHDGNTEKQDGHVGQQLKGGRLSTTQLILRRGLTMFSALALLAVGTIVHFLVPLPENPLLEANSALFQLALAWFQGSWDPSKIPFHSNILERNCIKFMREKTDTSVYGPVLASCAADMEGSSDKLFCCRWVRYRVPLTHREEMYHILRMTGPLLLSRILNYLLPFVVTMFCGRLGNEVMAGYGLASATINVTTAATGYGLGLACDTLISQTFGGKNLLRVGVILQRGIIILLMFCLPCWGLLINAQAILLCMGQDPEVARIAQLYITGFLPAVPAMFLQHLQVSYLQNQGIILPQMYTAAMANIANVVTNYIFLYWLDLGVSGSAAANALSQIYICGFLFAYIWWKKLHVTTWGGWSVESLQEWGSYMKLAIPSTLMKCFEWWVYELGGFLAGMLSEDELAAQHAVIMVAFITYMFPLGVQAAACARVGNALGAGNTARAILTSKVSLTLAGSFSVVEGLVLGSTKKIIGFIFTSDEKIVGLVSHLMNAYCFLQFFDGLVCVCTGIFVGTGKQKIPAVANLIGYYGVGLSLSVTFMFVAKLRVLGFWLGLLVCVVIQSTFYITVIFKLNWEKMTEEAVDRAQKHTHLTLLSTAALSDTTDNNSADQIATNGTSADSYMSVFTEDHDVNVETQRGHAVQQPEVSRLSTIQLIIRRGLTMFVALALLAVGASVHFLLPLPKTLQSEANVTLDWMNTTHTSD